MENLREFYELCKNIKPELFNYSYFVGKSTHCGTIGCLWGNAPYLLPDKIFRYKVNVTTNLCATNKYANRGGELNNTGAIIEYFKPKNETEILAIESIFFGEEFYDGHGNVLVEDVTSREMETISLKSVLDRFKLILDAIS